MKPFKLTQDQLFNACRSLSSSNHIELTEHAELRMKERYISYDNILSVLKRPIKMIDNRYEKKYNNYSYKIQGANIYHDIVVAIDFKAGAIIIVTVIDNRL